MEHRLQGIPHGIELHNLLKCEYHLDIGHEPMKDGREQFYGKVYRGGVKLEPGEALGALIWVDPDLWPDTMDAAEQAKTWIDRHAEGRKRRRILVSSH